MHASGWVSSLSESSLTKSCQLSNCQWAIWVRQHLSEELSLSTDQGKTPPTPWVDKYPASSSKQEGTEVMIRLEEEPSHVLFKLSWHPISYRKKSKFLKMAENTLPNYLASSLIPSSLCFILEQR